MATYRIGPTDFFTGADLHADAITLNSQVTALDRLVEGIPQGQDPLGSDLEQSWFGFTAQWRGYFHNTYEDAGGFSDFLTALNDGNRDQLIQYEQRFADYAQRMKEKGISSAAVNVALSLGAPDTVTNFLAGLENLAKRILPYGLGLGTLCLIVLGVWFFLIPRFR